MTKGWFIGDFEPNLHRTEDFEVGVKTYAKGSLEARHHHKISTEYTCIVSGRARMNTYVLEAGSIVEIKPGESTDFEALTDCITVVVKVPSSKNDKYLD
jgi:mannose-6-phosphate isomerase-like protein (cupin superfamily)